jgi:hypothetical protein
MKIYILCFPNGAKYPYNLDGGNASFLSKRLAEKKKALIQKDDKLYCQERGGLQIETLEGSENLLRGLGFRWTE